MGKEPGYDKERTYELKRQRQAERASLRKALYREQGGACVICHHPLWLIESISQAAFMYEHGLSEKECNRRRPSLDLDQPEAPRLVCQHCQTVARSKPH